MDVNKKLFSPVFLSVFLLLTMSGVMLITFTTPVDADLAIIRVPADYPTIQKAVDAASPGDIILVTSGTYYEHVTVKKSLTLIGEDRTTTIIDGNGTGNVIYVTTDSVRINGFTIRNGSGGIYVNQSKGSIISSNIIVSNGFFGIRLNASGNNTVLGNTISGNRGGGPGLWYGYGVELSYSHSNVIDGNTVENSVFGIALEYSCNNSVTGNSIANNHFGIIILDSSDNMICQNNLMNNDIEVDLQDSYNITWDNGTEGNYWNDYTGLDDGSGGGVAGDGVGDTNLPHRNLDYYPLVIPWGPIPIVWDTVTYSVTLLSNSTVSVFQFLQPNKRITFDATGPPGTLGFCNVTISKTLLRDDPWTVLLNTTDVITQTTTTENETHTSLYFTYTHGNYKVQIIGTWVVPEFPADIVSPLLVIITICTVILRRKIKL